MKRVILVSALAVLQSGCIDWSIDPASDAGDGDADGCECREGPCCDGCSFLGSETRCDDSPLSAEYRCASGECGADAMRRGVFRHCSGASAECPTDVLREGDWETVQDCSADQICVFTGSTPLCHACEEGCSDGHCSEQLCDSGPCCEEGHFASSATRCSDTPETRECRCASGECGADLECRAQYRLCTGMTAACGSDHLEWNDWAVGAECSSDELCDASSEVCLSCSGGCEDAECVTCSMASDGECPASCDVTNDVDCGVVCVPSCDAGETCGADGECRCGGGAACTGGNECIDDACLPPSCGDPGACTPGVHDTTSCGRCGTQVDVCQPDCRWDTGTCTDEGECDPGTTVSTAEGCPAGQRRTLECGLSCSFSEVEACAVPMPVTFEFPTDADGYLSLSPWGPSAIEGTRSTSLYSATEMEMVLTPSGNYLASGCSLVAEVLLNGVYLGDFFVGWGSTSTVTETFTFPEITGPDYTVRYQTTEVLVGCGAVSFEEGDTPHTVTLRP